MQMLMRPETEKIMALKQTWVKRHWHSNSRHYDQDDLNDMLSHQIVVEKSDLKIGKFGCVFRGFNQQFFR